MPKEFLGSGIKFPVSLDPAKKMKLSRHEEDIKEAIWLILSTAKGERVMRPDFGCGIHDLVFDPINTETLNLVEATVREALIFYEPRIDVIDVSVSAAESHLGKLLISIDYQVRTTNSEFNVVYPFYLKEGFE